MWKAFQKLGNIKVIQVMSRSSKYLLSTMLFIGINKLFVNVISNRNCIEKQTTTGQASPISNIFTLTYSVLEK